MSNGKNKEIEQIGIDTWRGNSILPKQSVILQKESDHWGLLYDTEKDFSFGINPVSIFIWEQLNGQKSINEILTEIPKYFTSTPQNIESDIAIFIANLVKNDLVIVKKR